MIRSIVFVGFLLISVVGFVPAMAAAGPNVNIDIHIGGPPQLVVVPRTPVYYAPTLPYNYFFYGGQYYVYHNGAWFFGPTFNGPWGMLEVRYVPRPILAVPVEYYGAPPGHWKKKGPPPWAPAWGHRKKWKEDD
jgi:hypothetical protein